MKYTKIKESGIKINPNILNERKITYFDVFDKVEKIRVDFYDVVMYDYTFIDNNIIDVPYNLCTVQHKFQADIILN